MPTSITNYLAELIPLLASPATPLLDSQFDQLARQLFATQFRLVQPYRNLCLARGCTPASLTHWTHIPSVPTASFKEFDWTSLPPDDRTTVFHSSGTTADTPSRHFHDARSLEIYERSVLAWARGWLFPHDSQRLELLILTPDPGTAPHSSLVHMFDVIRREWGTADSGFAGACNPAGQWILPHHPVRSHLIRSQAEGRPLALLGTAFLFVELLDQLRTDPIPKALPPGSRILETGGYKGRSRALPKPELYRQLTECLGISSNSIVSEYGMCELSSQAYDHAAGTPETGLNRTFRFPPWTRAVIVNPDTNALASPGESGLLRLFDLANVRSVMAIQTEDLARAHPHGFQLLGRATTAQARGCSLMGP
ncbi:MAG: hypothetical protein KJ072_17425 [Verrucomicrobia bacterium]|nr:hypothetical protein [Verrucomicrobiota bacterium]